MQYSFISFPKRNAVLLPIKCGRLMVGNPYENILLTWQAWQATSRQRAGGQPKMQQSNSCWIRIQTANIFNLLVIQGYQFLIATNVVFNGSLTLAASSCMMPSQVTTPHPHPHTYILQVWIYTHGKWSYIKVHGPVKSNQPFNVFVHQEAATQRTMATTADWGLIFWAFRSQKTWGASRCRVEMESMWIHNPIVRFIHMFLVNMLHLYKHDRSKTLNWVQEGSPEGLGWKFFLWMWT